MLTTLLLGCYTPATNNGGNELERGTYTINEREYKYKVVIIDECEYIMFSDPHSGYGGTKVTHKGNCKNCRDFQEKLFNRK